MYRQWVKGWNGGLTGPNTPSQPTVHYSIAMRAYRDGEGKVPHPKCGDYYIPIACGDDTVAIAVGPDREATADMIARAPRLAEELNRAKARIETLEAILEGIQHKCTEALR